MLVDHIRRGFEQSGYQTVSVNIQDIYLYYTRVNECVYAVCLMDYSQKTEFSKDQYNNIVRQVKQYIMNMGSQEVHLLSVISTKFPERVKSFCQEEDSHWIVDEQGRRLIIYENQLGKVWNAKRIIEDVLLENQYTTVGSSEATFTEKIKHFSFCNSIIIALNILVFLRMEITGSTEDVEYMLKSGAMYWPYVIEQSQYYRLFTHIFLHFGIQHLFNNMLVLGIIGDNLERVIGKRKFVFVYLCSGVLAGLASMVYNMRQDTIVVAAGASGAIFGVVGAMLYIVVANRGRVEDISTRQLGILVILSLYSGFTSQGVDNMAHIGGFVVGFVLAMILYRKQNNDHETLKFSM